MMATAASVSRKRKRDEERVLLGDPFVIQPHPSSVFDTSIKITPAVLLPRKCIPLNWLSGVPARLFSANIPALSIPGHVLVIKTDGERQLSAVERISEEAYTLYKLSPNVKMKEVRKLAQLTRKSHSPSPEVVDGRVINSSADWWAGLLMERLSLDKDCSKGRSVVLSMIHPSKAKLELAKSQSPQSQNLRILSPPAETAVFREPTATEFLEQIRTQYLDALYVAKTAIAYFAKSTLSRARVRFQQEPSDSTAPPPLSSLVDFLQDMLLPLDKMDLKYRKVLVQVATEETVEDKSIFKTEEEVYIHRWLNMNFKDKLLQSNDPGLKRQSEELKIRETELQIILLLEILALTKDTALPEQTAPGEDLKKKKKRKKDSKSKKSRADSAKPDPNVSLDLLLDRLCIWRSIGPTVTSSEHERPQSSHVKDGEEDRLKNFCVEVVMPFYSSRLPELCASIQKKFGGTTASAPGPPGSVTKSAKRKKIGDVPSLSMPNTTQSGNNPSSRKSTPAALDLQKTKNVDLVAAAKKTLQKREIQIPALNTKPAISVEDELKDAIKTLAKPNRAAVGAKLMEEASKRLSATSLRKSKKPVRNPNANVQVTGTPSKKDRMRKMQQFQQLMSPHGDGEDGEDDHLLPCPKLSDRRNTQAASVFESPVKQSLNDNRLFHKNPNRSYLPIGKIETVPDSSPGRHVLSTPLKGKSTVQKQIGNALTNYVFPTSDDLVAESSPVHDTPRILSSFTKTRSCLFPPMPRTTATTLALTSSPPPPALAETPQKRRRTIIQSQPFHEDNDDQDTEEDEHDNFLSRGAGHTLIDETPVRPRIGSGVVTDGTTARVHLLKTAGSTRLSFGKATVVADSPVNARRRSGGESRNLHRIDPSLESGETKMVTMAAATATAPGVSTSTTLTKTSIIEGDQEEQEVSIYRSLGWDDEDPLF